MTEVLSNATDQGIHDRVKEYFVWTAERHFEDDQPNTIATLHAWKNCGDVLGPLSRDDFIRSVREQAVDETTIVWEVWDGTRVWPPVQAEKLFLYREAHRTVIPSVKLLSSGLTVGSSDDLSAAEVVASVLGEASAATLPVKSGLLWRIPLIGWLFALIGWKPRVMKPIDLPPNSGGEPAKALLLPSVSTSETRFQSTTTSTDQETATSESDFVLSSSISEGTASSTTAIGGLSLDGLEDADTPTPKDQFQFTPSPVSDGASDAGLGTHIGLAVEEDVDGPPQDGMLHGAITNAVNYFDAKAKSQSPDEQRRADKPRLVERLMMAVIGAGRSVIWPIRGIIALAEKGVASERTLVTGESFLRLETTVRRVLGHPVTWGVATSAVLLTVAFVFLQPRGPDELDLFAVRKLKEAQEAIQALRASQPDEKTWTEFSATLTAELDPVKEELQRGMNINRPVKEGLYLALEYRLPRILKEGRLKPSPVEGEFDARIRNAEHQIQLLSR